VNAFTELLKLLGSASANVRRLSASALGKLAWMGIIGEFQIRPDFYLPELDLYIECWGIPWRVQLTC
jgi:hypothetical protein